MSHTQGPWNVYPESNRYNLYELWDENDNFHKDVSFAEMQANARLMSVSPNMYEAIVKMLDYWERTGPMKIQYEKLEDHIRNMKNAIAPVAAHDPIKAS